MTERRESNIESASAEESVNGTANREYETHDSPLTNPAGLGQAPAFEKPLHPGEVGTLGPYRVVKELGRGGMGAVYLGFDDRLQRKVALKVMLPQYAAVVSSRTRFLREARAIASITHDHIVTIYEVDDRDGTTYLVMPLLQGKPLDLYLNEKGTLKLKEILRIGRETATGLAAAHACGLVHRDIKPGNLWLETPKGRVKILDFGLAKPAETEQDDCGLTAAGAVLGTPSYMAFEQAMGEKVDFRADLYSLGVLLYRLTAGRLPFTGATAMDLLTAMATEEPAPVRALNPEVPEPLARLIHQLLAKKATDRPESATKVAATLRQLELDRAAVSVPAIPWDSIPTATQLPVGVDAFANIDATDAGIEDPAAPPPRRSYAWPLAAVGLLLVACLALTPQLIETLTPKGTLVIESTDPDVEVTIKKDGAVVVDRSKAREIALRVGDNYTIDLSEPKDGLKLNTDKFEITRDGKATIKVQVKVRGEKPKDAEKAMPAAAGKDAEKAIPAAAAKDGLEVDERQAALLFLKAGFRVVCSRPAGGHVDVVKSDDLPKDNFDILMLCDPRYSLDPTTIAAMRPLKQLHTFSSHQDILPAGSLVTLATFPCARTLTTLVVNGSRLERSDFAALSSFVKLEMLSFIDASSLDDEALKSLTGLTQLHEISLNDNRVTNAGLKYLAKCPLTTLALGRSDTITDDAVPVLIAMGGLKNLSCQDTAISAAGVKQLSAALPLCKIGYRGGVIGRDTDVFCRPQGRGVRAGRRRGRPTRRPNRVDSPSRETPEWGTHVEGGRTLGESETDRRRPGLFQRLHQPERAKPVRNFDR